MVWDDGDCAAGYAHRGQSWLCRIVAYWRHHTQHLCDASPSDRPVWDALHHLGAVAAKGARRGVYYSNAHISLSPSDPSHGLYQNQVSWAWARTAVQVGWCEYDGATLTGWDCNPSQQLPCCDISWDSARDQACQGWTWQSQRLARPRHWNLAGADSRAHVQTRKILQTHWTHEIGIVDRYHLL